MNLRQNKNTYTSAYGKYFAEVDTKEPLNLKGFAKHISDHGSHGHARQQQRRGQQRLRNAILQEERRN